MSKIWKSTTISLDHESFPIPTAAPYLPVQATEATSDEMATQERHEQILLQRVHERLSEIELERGEILKVAQAEAADILRQAHEEVVRLRADAEACGREDGYAAGYDEGLQACQATCDELIVQAQTVVRETTGARNRVLESLAEPLGHLTIEAVQTLLARELELAPANVEEIVNGLLRYVMESSLVEVRVHPDDFSQATAAHPKWSSAKFGEWEVSVVPDLSVTRGGCEIRSQLGRVDARMETRLELLQEQLRRIASEEVNHFVG